MERANDVTWFFLDLRLLPALPVAWLRPRQLHNPQVSWQPIQIFVFLQNEAGRPIYGYVQSPDFTTVTTSPSWQFTTLPARRLFLKYTIAEMDYIKAPTSTSQRRKATLRGAWGGFHQYITRMPTLHYMFHISPVLCCFRKCAKMHTFESERVKGCFNYGNFRKSIKKWSKC